MDPVTLSFEIPRCDICGCAPIDAELHAHWHEELDRGTAGDRWNKGRDDRYREEEDEQDHGGA